MIMREIVNLPLAEIRRYANNPRRNDHASNRVAASIKDFGFTNPIILDASKTIICGDTRYLAALMLKLPTVPCIVRDDLTEEQAAALRIADNKTAELAEWDRDKLKAELAAIGCGVNMGMLGFDVPRADDGAEDSPEAVGTEVATITKPGCVWHLGRHRLMCGDSTKGADMERLMGGKTAALCLTDPPYNVDYEGDACADIIENDNLGAGFRAFLFDVMRQIVDHTRGPVISFISCLEMSTLYDAFTMAGGHFAQWGFWVKGHFSIGRSDYQRKHEPFLYGWAGDERPRPPGKMADVLKFKKPIKSALHPTMKPVALFEAIIKANSAKGDLVLDPFGGSGTAIMAAERQHRTAYAMELSPVFCDRIVERFKADFGGETFMEAVEDG